MRLPVILSLVATASAVSCAAPQQATIPTPPITCRAGSECNEKWSRANGWIAQHSGYKVQIASDSLIRTMGPFSDDPTMAFVVTKIAQGNDIYLISINGGCGPYGLILGCIPSIPESVASFTTFVNGVSDAAKPN